jgi:tetratricopeptide (TPR) repeat protein
MTEKPSVQNNLPCVPDTGVVGREQELAEIIKALLDPDIPIVTLVGMAGIGKTTLALAVAHCLGEQGEFPGGIVWLNASEVQSLDKVWEKIREALDLPSPQAARRHLHEYPTLLILDGLDEAAQDMEMLAFLDRLPRPSKVLVTSRKRIGLVGKELVVGEDDITWMPAQIRISDAVIDGDVVGRDIIIGDGVVIEGDLVGRDIIVQGPFEKDTYLSLMQALALALAYERSNYLAAIQAYSQVLERFGYTKLTEDEQRLYAETNHRLGVCLRLDGQWRSAVEQQEETFRQFKKLRDFHGQGRAYLEIARAYQAMSSYDLAVLYYRDAHRLFRRAGDVTLAATAKEELGNLEYYLRILKPAMADWEEAAHLYEQAGRPGKVAIIRQNLAQAG